jgi:heme/copper-type cytochrome/quinol oxidase subunit 4
MKAVNIILGIATAIILGALINLGIKAFYPEPAAPAYANYPVAAVPCASADIACQTAQTAAMNQQNTQQAQQQQTYENEMSVYNKNLFIIANIVGILLFALGFWLIFGAALASLGVPIGVMVAGLWGIMYGYIRGWGSVDDQLKFFIGLVIAIVVIGGSMWLMQRYQKKSARK